VFTTRGEERGNLFSGRHVVDTVMRGQTHVDDAPLRARVDALAPARYSLLISAGIAAQARQAMAPLITPVDERTKINSVDHDTLCARDSGR
jgi:hypothetical protein